MRRAALMAVAGPKKPLRAEALGGEVVPETSRREMVVVRVECSRVLAR
ncbi:MAG TPA: hypothetical protein VK997_07220 [Deferrisomatales bacterium]|nr:hypothetical protein [Deferrisomatales bacterium]